MDSGPLVKANASMIREVQPASPFDFHGTAPRPSGFRGYALVSGDFVSQRMEENTELAE